MYNSSLAFGLYLCLSLSLSRSLSYLISLSAPKKSRKPDAGSEDAHFTVLLSCSVELLEVSQDVGERERESVRACSDRRINQDSMYVCMYVYGKDACLRMQTHTLRMATQMALFLGRK